MNLTGCITSSGARYDLARVGPEAVKSEFMTCLLRDRHVLFDWGQHALFVGRVSFVVDYDKKEILVSGTGAPVGDDQWVYIDPENFHALLESVFEGEWGPTAADLIVTLERSGVTVDLCGCAEYGPPNPKEYIFALRQALKA